MLSPAVTLNVRVTVNVRTAVFNYQIFYIFSQVARVTILQIVAGMWYCSIVVL